MKKWLFIFFALLALIGGAISFAAWHWLWSEFEAAGPLTNSRNIVIPKGMGTKAIAEKLEAEGVIADPLVFWAAIRYLGKGSALKAGEFSFPIAVTPHQVMDILVQGQSVSYSITVPEGLTSRQIVALIETDPVLTGVLGDVPAEGTLLPETYQYQRGDKKADIIAWMQKSMISSVDELWPHRAKNLPFDTKEQAIILASIVERETAVAAERPRVAAVFINRLKKGMKLQSDPTVIYGVSDGLGVIERPITKSDLASPHPYNTYIIPALPPGPIANPGRESLAAVLNPADTDDLYFVADGTGGHAFAKTLADHNRNVAKWRAIERDATRSR